MKHALATLAALALVCGCATSDSDNAAKEWQRAECNRVIDKEDRDRCLKRVEENYGGRSREEPKKPAPSRY